LNTIAQYLQLGFTHVIPLGFDHILFILSLFLLNSNLKSVLIQCSIFTLAHSIALGLSAAGYIVPNPLITEPLIALSIVFTSVENIVRDTISKWRLPVIFVFGMVHGMGFAGALKDAGIPANNFITALLSFNVGVELGQIAVLLLAWGLVGKWFSQKSWYKKRIVYPASTMIACIAMYWFIERILV